MSDWKGKFITIYGINGIGKTTQTTTLHSRIGGLLIKYPIYDLAPSGPILNAYLRKGNPYKLTPREAQMFYAMNRTQYEPRLIQSINENHAKYIIAEDYTGTGIAWGIGTGVDKKFLLEINSHLLKEDISIVMIGERFETGVEKDHKHEKNLELTRRVNDIHLELAKEFGWHIINANQSKEKVHKDIWEIVSKELGYLTV
ncbi:MAG: hypothetical protein Q8Q06_00770 [bacterium]|nr:hypothetical protein [bacterium]